MLFLQKSLTLPMNSDMTHTLEKHPEGYFRVAAAFPIVKISDVDHNLHQSLRLLADAQAKGCEMLVLPELGLSGYTCADLFNQQLLLQKVREALIVLAESTSHGETMLIVGAPIEYRGRLMNCGVALASGRIMAIVPKSYLPNYNEFYERRWFASGLEEEDGEIDILTQRAIPIGRHIILKHCGVMVGIEICEDLWVPTPPSNALCTAGAEVIANLSATDELISKHDYLLNLISSQSARCRCGYVYSSAGPGESSTDCVYAGNAIIAEDGNLLAESPRFSEEAQMVMSDIDVMKIRADRRHFGTYYENHAKMKIIQTGCTTEDCDDTCLLRDVNPYPFVPSAGPRRDERCREVTSIQTAALVQRLRATQCRALTIGISGGLDSTLALLIAVKAFDKLDIPRSGIYALTMPGFGTTSRTHDNALQIMERLGVTSVEISIADAVNGHFADIGHDPNVHDVTYENCQARERTQILMDYANRVGGMVLGTGDLSELALGWCTYNADHMSMYAVNCSVPKTLVRHLVSWMASKEEDPQLREALMDIVDTPVSPELLPASDDGTIAQKTEDLVGPYELHDFFLYHCVRHGFSPSRIFMLARKAFDGRYDHKTIIHWLHSFYKRFFTQQFKRSCIPDGPKTGSISLSPRADWRMPSDATSRLWLEQVEDMRAALAEDVSEAKGNYE